MSAPFIFERLGIALLLGFLVGLQREKSQSVIAGFRTFPLITILGALCGILANHLGVAPFIGGILGLISLIVVGNIAALRAGKDRTGITTEVAMLVMFLVGVYLIVGHPLVAVAIGGGVAALLQFKPQLHGFAARLGESDLNAIMRFVLIAFIVLPILPNETFGPFEVLNPHEIWLMVVFIVGMNLAGYIVSKFVTPKTGILTSGILGGLISSTATTVSYSRSSRENPRNVPQAATILLIASTFAYARVLGETAAVSSELFHSAFTPLAVLFGVSSVFCAILYFSSDSSHSEVSETKFKGEVRSALLFGFTYAAVVFGAAIAKKYFGPSSLYWVAGISGWTDVDAIALSSARMVSAGKLEAAQGADMIVMALLSNLLFKIGIVAFLGDRKLLIRLGGFLGLSIAIGVALILLT